MPFSYLNTSSINTGATTIPAFNTDRFPATGIIQMGTELMNYSAAATGGDITAARGYLGSDAAGHTDHDKINLHPTDVFTRGGTGTRATATTTGAAGRAKTVGLARTRAYEVGTPGTEITSVQNWNSHPIESTFHHYIFDVRMLCKLTLAAGPKFNETNFVTNGSRIKGSKSGATGIVYIPPQDITFNTAGSCAYNNTTDITVDSTAGIEVGMGVIGSSGSAGIPQADGNVSYVTQILTATTCKLSAATTGGAKTSQTLTFGNVVDADDGTKYSRGITFHVIQTAGNFQADDVLTSSNSADFATSGALAADPTYYTMADAHSVYGTNSQTRPYYADICPKETKKLTGTASTVSSATATGGAAESIFVLGTNTQFTSDLKIGDLI